MHYFKSTLLAVLLPLIFTGTHGGERLKGKIPVTANGSAYQGLTFVENKGQWHANCLYRATLNNGITLFAGKDRFTYVLADSKRLQQLHDAHGALQEGTGEELINCHAFEMIFKNCNPSAVLESREKKPFYHNYFLGSDQSRWAGGVGVYGRLDYQQIYQGVDVSMYEAGGQLKYDYIIHPGYDVRQIVLEFRGAERAVIRDGKLVIVTSVGDIIESIPESYQIINGEKIQVQCAYVIGEDGTVRFQVADYDPRFSLVIDPVVMASTYSGGTSTSYGHCATYDLNGNIYGGARCFALGFPTTTGAFQTSFGGNVDMAISKLDASGVNLLFATYIGGSSRDLPHSMFVASNGDLYIFGSTQSNNYPVSSSAYDGSSNGQDDIVISKLNSSGTTMLASTYVGGSAVDGVNQNTINYSDNFRGEIVVNSTGQPYVTSVTKSSNFPVTTGAYDTSPNGGQDAVLFKMDVNLSSLLWSTLLGGTDEDGGFSLRIDANGDVLVAGFTEGGGFPVTTGALNTTYLGGAEDGYVARFNSLGTSLINCTFIGSAQRDMTFFVELDPSGNVYIFGNTLGSTPISSGVYNNPGSQNFLMKLNPALNSAIWSTVLGGGSHQLFSPSALMVDVCENVYISGWGTTSGYPMTTNAVQTQTIASGFHLMVLNGTGTNLTYAGPFGFGGEHVDGGTSRFDPNGIVYQCVCACSNNFPTLPGNYAPSNLAPGCDMAIFKINFQTNCTGFTTNTVICAGGSASFSITNFGNLSNATYSVKPGPIIPVNQVFTVAPTSSTNYTVYITGTNSLNATVTHTGTAVVIVVQQPSVAPTLTQASCTSSANGINLNLTFVPTTTHVPTYTVNWSQVPGGIGNNTATSTQGPVLPGVYSATVAMQNGCKATTTFTILPQPPAVTITINGPFSIDCVHPTRTITLSPPQHSYTWTSNPYMYTGNTATFNVYSPLFWTVYAYDPIYGCSDTAVFALSHNTTAITSALSPTFQNITCTVSSIQTISASISPSVNVEHWWISSQGGTVVMPGGTGVFVPGAPDTYTHVAYNTSNGCKAVKTFTVYSNAGFPTFTLTSPQNYTLGCGSKSVAIVNVDNAQTTPTAGGAISYTMLPPGHSGNYGFGTTSSYTSITVPGTYTFIVRSANNSCETKVQASILQHTLGPDLAAVIPNHILTCFRPSEVLGATSTNANADFVWMMPGAVSLNADTMRVFTSSVETQTVTGIYTLVATDMNNACATKTVITILQNIIPPIAGISGPSEISCKTPSITLTNNSLSRIPDYFNPTRFVSAYEWSGPSPQVPLQLSTNYVANHSGNYTLVAMDMSNGCTAVATKSVADNVIYPLINIPEPPEPFILDCGTAMAKIHAKVEGDLKNFAYEWHAHSATVTSFETDTTYVNATGVFEVNVTNTVNGCSGAGFVEVVRGHLTAEMQHDQKGEYAPSTVSFTNLSTSSSQQTGKLNITSVWNFGNGSTLTTPSASVNLSTLYTQPGTYTVTLFARKGECLDTAWTVLNVEMPSRLTIPNVFTPNGDGVNDLLFVNGAMLKEIAVTIYDRWGHVVYELTSTTGNFEWDGMNQRGEAVPDGSYLIVLKATGADGMVYESNDTVTLLR